MEDADRARASARVVTDAHPHLNRPPTIDTIARVARALGLQPSDLLDRDPEPQHQPDDAEIVGAILTTHRDGLDDVVLARALLWPTARVETALAALAAQAPAIGQSLRRIHGHNTLVPANIALDRRRTEALARASQPLDADHARALLQVLRGNTPTCYWHDYTTAERDCLMHLVAQGALHDNGSGVQPTGELRAALTIGYNRIICDFPRTSRFAPGPAKRGDDLYWHEGDANLLTRR